MGTVDQATRVQATERSLLFMMAMAFATGLVAGVGAWSFRLLIGLVHNVLFLGEFTFAYDANLHTPPSPWGLGVVLVPVVGALVVAWLVGNFAPEAKGHGVPEVMDAIHYHQGRIRPRVAVVKSLASAISIGSGGSVGREGQIAEQLALDPKRAEARTSERLFCAGSTVRARARRVGLGSSREEAMAETLPMVLTEDEALELLAFLVTAARTQLDEAAEYGSLRLLTAANRLADAVADRVSPATRAILTGPLRQIPELSVRTADPAGYAAALDDVCRAVAEHVVTHFGVDRSTP
jgi:Family of unknown function (DUF6092)/Voltage gated chloride channel